MKKYITLAALLTAGAAFANAEEVIISFGETTSLALDKELDLTKNWDFDFSLLASPYNMITGEYTEATILSSNAFSLVSDATANIVLSVGEKSTTVTVEGWAWSGMMSAGTDFLVSYAAETKEVTASIQVEGATLATATLSAIGYEGLTLSSVTTGITSDLTSNGWSLPTGTITGSAIPEPSAFGLLAGLGALALVGTRRRRK